MENTHNALKMLTQPFKYSSFYRGPSALIFTCVICLLSYIGCKLWTPVEFNRWLEAIFVLPFIYIMCKNWGPLKKNTIFTLAGLMILIPVLQYAILFINNPESAALFSGPEKLLKLMFFIAAAWWLGANQHLIKCYLLLSFIGFVVLILSYNGIENEFFNALKGHRVGFGSINAQFAGVYSGLSLIGLLTFAPEINKIGSFKGKVIGILLLILGIVFSGSILVATQTRAAWLGLIICILILISYHSWAIFKSKSGRNKTIAIITLSIVTLISAFYFSPPVIERLNSGISSIQPYLSGESKTPPQSSIGYRIELWLVAINAIKEKPMTGWGGESRKSVIINAPGSSKALRDSLHHFHNSWFEFGVAYGLPGVLLLTSLFLWLNIKAWRKWRENEIPNFIYLFTSLGSLFFIITNLFESYLFFTQGAYLMTVIAAPAMSYLFKLKAADKLAPPMRCKS